MKVSFNRFSIFLLLFASIIYLSSCASMSKQSSSTPGQGAQEVEKNLPVASVLRFDDLPVPSGFKIIPDGSVAFQNDASRFAFLKYRGIGSPDQMLLFFKEQMPLYNWQLINLIEYGAKVMNFEKAGENCTITIEGSASKSVVMVSLTPKAATRSRK